MKLKLSNIGKIQSADIEINGITVIAGDNNTGKSTVGKALFAVFNSFYDIENKMTSERKASIRYQLETGGGRDHPINFSPDFDIGDLAEEILRSRNDTSTTAVYDIINNYEFKFLNDLPSDECLKISERISQVLQIPNDKIVEYIIQGKLDSEFNEQISNLFANGISSIELQIRGEQVVVQLLNDKIVSFSGVFHLGTEAVYMDDPFVLDEVPARIWRNNNRYSDHRTHLKEKLSFTRNKTSILDEIITDDKLKLIYNKLSSVCDGDIVREKTSALSYRIAGSDKTLNVKNLSTGLKTFAILKKLLTNGSIESNGTLILDEPEIHLHPEWQLVFAELIVLLHHEFGLHILLNTHSPYFLNAIEVYSVKYGVDDRCKYYLAKNSGNVACIEDVTNSIENIYSTLAQPLQELEDERYRYGESQ